MLGQCSLRHRFPVCSSGGNSNPKSSFWRLVGICVFPCRTGTSRSCSPSEVCTPITSRCDVGSEVLQLCRSALISWADMVLEPSVAGLFKWRQFEPEMILLAVGWYLRFSLSYRDVEELLAERGLLVDHVTVWRWVQRYTPQIERQL